MDDITVKREVSVEVPTTSPEGKCYRLHLEGNEIRIEHPVAFKAPRVKLSAMERAISELVAMAGSDAKP